MTSNNKIDDPNQYAKWRAKKQTAYITGCLHEYVSSEAHSAINRLVNAGYDLDLAFALVESSLPETKFYEFPEDQ